MKITVKDAMELYEAIERLCQRNDIDFKLSYALGKNQSKMRDIKSGLEKVMKSPNSKAQIAFDEERIALAAKHARKGPDQKPLMTRNAQGQQEYQVEDMAEFNADLKLIRDKYPDLMSALEKQKDDLESLMEKEEEIDFYMVPLSVFPEKMNMPMRVFMPVIQDPGEDLFKAKEK